MKLSKIQKFLFLLLLSFFFQNTNQYDPKILGNWIINYQRYSCRNTCQFQFGSEFQVQVKDDSKTDIVIKQSGFQLESGLSKIIDNGNNCQTTLNYQKKEFVILPKVDTCKFIRLQLGVNYFRCDVYGKNNRKRNDQSTIFYNQKYGFEQLTFTWEQKTWDGQKIDTSYCSFNGIRIPKYQEANLFLGTYKVFMRAPYCGYFCHFKQGTQLIIAQNKANTNIIDIYVENDQTNKNCQKFIIYKCSYQKMNENQLGLYYCQNWDQGSEMFWFLEAIVDAKNKKVTQINLKIERNNIRNCLVYAEKISSDTKFPSNSIEKPIFNEKSTLTTSSKDTKTQTTFSDQQNLNKNIPKNPQVKLTNNDKPTITTSIKDTNTQKTFLDQQDKTKIIPSTNFNDNSVSKTNANKISYIYSLILITTVISFIK